MPENGDRVPAPEGDAAAVETDAEAPAVDRDGGAPEGAEPAGAEPPVSVEEIVQTLETVTTERDSYLALAREKQAEFENYRKQVMKRQAEHLEQAAAALVEKLLPVLDAFDYGIGHGHEDLAPMRNQLLTVLEKEGLSRVEPVGEAFNPNEHEAVVHEPGDGGPEVVDEVLRVGYRWHNRVLRPAMVKVKG